ncbi:MAG TPA: FkbM family methyltransferase [Parafilimonas sp.]|nr:FkbM family methyltransferase [Parafilimonas sp.]
MNKYSDYDKFYFLIKKIIKKKKNNNESFFFVEIGANDGKIGDPMFDLVSKFQLSGILVEPVPYLFERLLDNYRHAKNLFFENAAIADPTAELTFFRLVETPGLPVWHTLLGSFRKDVILRHREEIPNIEDLILEEKINVISFNDLMKKYSVSRISLLFIDTEGYDFEIIKTINFENYEIENILFENKHLSPEEQNDCLVYLKAKGFNTFVTHGGDTLAQKR